MFEPAEDRRQLTHQLIWFLAWLGVTIIGVALSPSASGHGTHQKLGLPPCPSVLLFDRPCPGCGLTTSWSAVLEGNFALAFSAHALGPIMYGMFTVTALVGMAMWVKKVRFKSESPLANRLFNLAMILFVAFGIARMALVQGIASPHERWLSSFGRQLR